MLRALKRSQKLSVVFLFVFTAVAGFVAAFHAFHWLKVLLWKATHGER